uniref:Uncharacterized protein n=1 Tax=Arundo donax TaxID=35708 RepID=A0A0A9GQW9_ARUDO
MILSSTNLQEFWKHLKIVSQNISPAIHSSKQHVLSPPLCALV